MGDLDTADLFTEVSRGIESTSGCGSWRRTSRGSADPVVAHLGSRNEDCNCKTGLSLSRLQRDAGSIRASVGFTDARWLVQ